MVESSLSEIHQPIKHPLFMNKVFCKQNDIIIRN